MAAGSFDLTELPPEEREFVETHRKARRGNILPLAPEVEKMVLDMVRRGAPNVMVSAALGISHANITNWRKRAESDHPKAEIAREFIEKFDAARIEGQMYLLECLYEQAKVKPDTAKYLLTIQRPEVFAERLVVARAAADADAARAAESTRAEELRSKIQADFDLEPDQWAELAEIALARSRRGRQPAVSEPGPVRAPGVIESAVREAYLDSRDRARQSADDD